MITAQFLPPECRHALSLGQFGAAAIVVVVLISAGALLGWRNSLLRSAVVSIASRNIGRPLDGALHIHLLEKNPRLEAEQVTIGNPPWTVPGITAEIQKLTVEFAPLFSSQSGLSLLKIDTARLYLTRDGAGRANWQRSDPDQSQGGSLPVIRALEVVRTHVSLADERLHLFYDGDVSVRGADPKQPLQLEGAGVLNQHPISLRLDGPALRSATRDKAYPFQLEERSTGATLTAHGSLPNPFDLTLVHAEFEASGSDLRDLYYLVGVRLPNTGAFRLHGQLSRRGNETLFDQLEVRSGKSDVKGQVSLESQHSGPTLAKLDLRLMYCVWRTSGCAPPGVSRIPIPLEAVLGHASHHSGHSAHRRIRALQRGSSADVTGRSTRPFSTIFNRRRCRQGAGHQRPFPGSEFRLETLNADTNETPARARIELRLKGLQLAQIPHKSDGPPYEGSLDLQVHALGRGDSLHAVAASADGTLRARVSEGTIRSSLAELTGVDLRGLGLCSDGQPSRGARSMRHCRLPHSPRCNECQGTDD